MLQVPSAQPREHLRREVCHLRERDADVVRKLLQLTAEQAFARRLRELLGLDKNHPAEHRGAGALCHQPGSSEQCVLVRRHRLRIEEAFEQLFLVSADRRIGVGLGESEHLVDRGKQFGPRTRVRLELRERPPGNRGPGSYGRYSSVRWNLRNPSVAARSIDWADTPDSTKAEAILTDEHRAEREPAVLIGVYQPKPDQPMDAVLRARRLEGDLGSGVGPRHVLHRKSGAQAHRHEGCVGRRRSRPIRRGRASSTRMRASMSPSFRGVGQGRSARPLIRARHSSWRTGIQVSRGLCSRFVPSAPGRGWNSSPSGIPGRGPVSSRCGRPRPCRPGLNALKPGPSET